jgi:hypothetical protein
MIVVGQYDAATGAHCSNEAAHDAERVGHVLEQEPCVREVESAPLRVAQRQVEGVSFSQFDQALLSIRASLSPGFGKLGVIALDPDDSRTSACSPGHGSGQLSDAAPDVQNRLAASEAQLAERSIVQEHIQPGEPCLLGRCRSMDVSLGRWHA